MKSNPWPGGNLESARRPRTQSPLLRCPPVPHGTMDVRYSIPRRRSRLGACTSTRRPTTRRMTSRLPVLYLLHGGDGEDSVWTAFGRAHVILDNLIAEKTIPPMVVVMPNGYAYGWDAGVGGGTTAGRLPTGSHRRPDSVCPSQLSRAERAEAARAGGPVTRRRSNAQHRPSAPGSLSRLGVFSAGSNIPKRRSRILLPARGK